MILKFVFFKNRIIQFVTQKTVIDKNTNSDINVVYKQM